MWNNGLEKQVENNTKCEEFLGEMCLEKEMDINHSKGLFAQDECLEEQIEPLESPWGKSLEKQSEKELIKNSTTLGGMFSKVSQSKTPSSTLDTLDVLSMKDKENI